MPADPIEEWRRLREHYSQLSDEELNELALDFGDLTQSAQQVLREELRNRGLRAPGAAGGLSNSTGSPWPQRPPGAIHPDDSEREALQRDEIEDDAPGRDYTWKTQLCECESTEQAWQIREVLRLAGIDSWVEQPGSGWGVANPRVVVAADQLEEAAEIMKNPIPQEIIDQFNTEIPEFEPPPCPKCGAGDPVLEGVEPVNSWRCEACGKLWSDPEAGADQKPGASNE
jgi:hypothetical protein